MFTQVWRKFLCFFLTIQVEVHGMADSGMRVTVSVTKMHRKSFSGEGLSIPQEPTLPLLSFMVASRLFPAPEQLSLFCSGGLFFRGCDMCVTGFPALRSWWTLQAGESGRDNHWWETERRRERKGKERGESLMPQLGILSSFSMESLMDMPFFVFPVLRFSHLMPLVSLMTQFIRKFTLLCCLYTVYSSGSQNGCLKDRLTRQKIYSLFFFTVHWTLHFKLHFKTEKISNKH